MLSALYVVNLVLSALASLAIIIGVLFAIRTFWNERAKIELDRRRISADLILRFDKMRDAYDDITEELDTNDPDFKPITKFGPKRVEALIGIYETMGQLANEDLVLSSMIYNDFSYEIERICQNNEIIEYISTLRKDDEDMYVNLLRLYSELPKGGKDK